MKPRTIRTIAICVILHRDHTDRIIVAEGYDPVKAQTFYRPLGGRIEFGELSRDTVVRELREEIEAEVTSLRYLGTLENIFTYNGEAGHEIVLVYTGNFADPRLYDTEQIHGRGDSGEAFDVVWKPLSDFNGQTPLYPEGLMELLG